MRSRSSALSPGGAPTRSTSAARPPTTARLSCPRCCSRCMTLRNVAVAASVRAAGMLVRKKTADPEYARARVRPDHTAELRNGSRGHALPPGHLGRERTRLGVAVAMRDREAFLRAEAPNDVSETADGRRARPDTFDGKDLAVVAFEHGLHVQQPPEEGLRSADA